MTAKQSNSPVYCLLGREPALWMSLFASIIMVVSSFVLPLSDHLQSVLNAACFSGFGVLTCYFVEKNCLAPSILGFVKALFSVAVGFGVDISSHDQAILMTAVSAVTAMFIRTQVTAVNSDEKRHTRAHT